MFWNLLLSVLVYPVFATNSFAAEDVAQHSTTDDCYMIFEDKVYDFTNYLQEHDIYYYDIDPWCGKDMTEDFQTKDGKGIDHKSRSYLMLDSYYIGDLITSTVANNEIVTENVVQSSETEASSFTKTKSPYNFILPFFGTLIVYFITEILVRFGNGKKDWRFNKVTEKLFWNTVLVLSLIPSTIFGFYLVLRYSIPVLREINFDFLYWHVEGSIIFGTVCVIHFLERLKIYFGQYKNLWIIRK